MCRTSNKIHNMKKLFFVAIMLVASCVVKAQENGTITLKSRFGLCEYKISQKSLETLVETATEVCSQQEFENLVKDCRFRTKGPDETVYICLCPVDNQEDVEVILFNIIIPDKVNLYLRRRGRWYRAPDLYNSCLYERYWKE